jgi:hypothetical protein
MDPYYVATMSNTTLIRIPYHVTSITNTYITQICRFPIKPQLAPRIHTGHQLRCLRILTAIKELIAGTLDWTLIVNGPDDRGIVRSVRFRRVASVDFAVDGHLVDEPVC